METYLADHSGTGNESIDDDQDWNGWEAESDADSSDSGDWIDVQSNASDVQFSDSEDEEKPLQPAVATNHDPDTAAVSGAIPGSSLATTKVSFDP